jgi:hypothetical protein
LKGLLALYRRCSRRVEGGIYQEVTGRRKAVSSEGYG